MARLSFFVSVNTEIILVFGQIGAVLEPAHHAAKFGANGFDLVFSVNAALSEEVGATGSAVFDEPVAGEGAVLNFGNVHRI